MRHKNKIRQKHGKLIGRHVLQGNEGKRATTESNGGVGSERPSL